MKKQAEYLPDVVGVKFKNRISSGEEAVSTGIASVDGLFNRYGVTLLKQFFNERFLRPETDRSVAIESIYNVFFTGPPVGAGNW